MRIIWFDTVLKIFSFIFDYRLDVTISPGWISIISSNYFIQNKVTRDIGSFLSVLLSKNALFQSKTIETMFIMQNMSFIRGRIKNL